MAFLLGAAFLGCDVAKAAAAPVGWGAKRRAQTATDKSNQVERQPERERGREQQLAATALTNTARPIILKRNNTERKKKKKKRYEKIYI